MAIPGQAIRSLYRNNVNVVANFLKEHHGDHFMIYNLSEFSYDYSKFGHNVKHYQFPDHHGPTIENLLKIMNSIDCFLKANEKNIVVVHCNAGMGRTGTIISSYMLYSGIFIDPSEALTWFAQKRTHNGRGVRVPSQIRYIWYLNTMMNCTPERPLPLPLYPTLWLHSIHFIRYFLYIKY
jgi:phosphatidylinositol-3,4,5-trisphosphate 3-phosphatase and dual-specificity protein phosphatase PTEN